MAWIWGEVLGLDFGRSAWQISIAISGFTNQTLSPVKSYIMTKFELAKLLMNVSHEVLHSKITEQLCKAARTTSPEFSSVAAAEKYMSIFKSSARVEFWEIYKISWILRDL